MATGLPATSGYPTAASSRETRFSHPLPQPASWPRPGGTTICGPCIPNIRITVGTGIKDMVQRITGTRSKSSGSVNIIGGASIYFPGVLSRSCWILRIEPSRASPPAGPGRALNGDVFPGSKTLADDHRLVAGAIDDRGREDSADTAIYYDVHQVLEFFLDHLRVGIFFYHVPRERGA